MTRGSAPYVEWLGAADNPDGKGWAVPGKGYGKSLLELLDAIKGTKPPQKPQELPEEKPEDNIPKWQKEGFNALVEAGIINTPEYWEKKLTQPITVGEALGIIGRVYGMLDK